MALIAALGAVSADILDKFETKETVTKEFTGEAKESSKP
jgi:hypothetical protein